MNHIFGVPFLMNNFPIIFSGLPSYDIRCKRNFVSCISKITTKPSRFEKHKVFTQKDFNTENETSSAFEEKNKHRFRQKAIMNNIIAN